MNQFFTHLFDAMFSVQGLAVVVGLIISWGGTQTAKKHGHFGGFPAALTAFVLGLVPTYFVWPGYGSVALFAGTAVGLSAPTAYKVSVFFVRKRWPKLADELSGDRRA